MRQLIPPIWIWFLLPLIAFFWSAQGVYQGYIRYQKARGEVLALESEAKALASKLSPTLAEAPVKREELPKVYEALLRLAEEAGLELEALNPLAVAQTGGIRAWGLEVSLKGPYPGILSYLETLPKIPYPLWVERYSLEPVEGTRGERLTLDLTLRILSP